MYPSIQKIKTILIKQNYLTPEDGDAAEAASNDTLEFIAYLYSHDLLTRSLLGQALAEAYKLPFADLSVYTVNREVVQLLPEDIARSMRIVISNAQMDSLEIATDQPEAIEPAKVLKLFKGKKVRLAYTLPEYLEQTFESYVQPLSTRFSQIIENSSRVAPEIVDEIIKDALSFKASDIHFEPQSDTVIVRFRVDGTLREAGTVPKAYYDNVLNRIKVESGMRIDEHLISQDGAMQRQTDGAHIDLRVSLIPTVEGEKIVMRVLGSYVAGLNFNDIGFSAAHNTVVDQNIAKPFGMILTVGPTGSGKTTTLYSLLKLLNKPNVNITTIEDPVEYKMAGTNQIQVRDNGNMTFAKGLRSIVRQDPDVILVGEIRDQETAEIAVNAALTGHLLLSSFHANDASTAIPRLIDMGIEPFLLSSTLEIVIAQRLVRKLCVHCRYSVPASEAMQATNIAKTKLSGFFKKEDTVYNSKGCAACGGTGFKGRVALFEIIEITPEMQDLMLDSPSNRHIETLARKQGSKAMFDDGVEKVKLGLSTLDEILRVVPLAHT